MHQRSLREIGIDKDKLPVSSLKKQAIQEAMKVLKGVATTLGELEELRKLGMRASIEEVNDVMVRLADLSSSYYELVPMAEQKDNITKPIFKMH